MSKSQRIQARLVPVKKVSDGEKMEMYNLFIRYYDNVDVKTFLKDFSKKEHVFILRKKDSNTLVGFSTLTRIMLSVRGRKNIGIFSGDTVVEKEYWGTTAIHYGFMKYIFMERIRHPTARVFWFLITKGYKTYLLMANNWANYYPRFDKEYDPRIKSLTKRFCDSLYPGVYDDATGLLAFGADYQKLKEDVAEIDDTMKEKFPKIAFFDRINPTWREGTELPCLGEIDWVSIFKCSLIFVAKKSLRFLMYSTKVGKQLHQTRRQVEVASFAPAGVTALENDGLQSPQLEKTKYVA